MAKAKEVFKVLTSLSGASADNASLTQVFEALGDIELDDEVKIKLQQNLIPKDSAKDNSEIVNSIKAPLFNAVDAKFIELMDAYKFSEEEKKAVMGDGKNTYDKPKLFSEVLKTRHEKAMSELGGSDDKIESIKSQYQKQLDELISQTQTLSQEKESLVKSHEDRIRNLYIDNLFKGHKYANGLNPEHGALVAKAEFEKALRAEGIQIVSDENESYKLMQGDLKYQREHKPVSLDDFVKNVLAENKLLAASTPPLETPKNLGSGNNEVKGLEAFLQKNEEQIAGSQHTA